MPKYTHFPLGIWAKYSRHLQGVNETIEVRIHLVPVYHLSCIFFHIFSIFLVISLQNGYGIRHDRKNRWRKLAHLET